MIAWFAEPRADFYVPPVPRSCRQLFRAVTPYQGVAKALIWRLKFGRAQAAARDIALLLQLPPEAGHARLLVHVPTATSRVRQRGYDQARLIARRVSALHGIAYVPALVRHGQQRQVGMSG